MSESSAKSKYIFGPVPSRRLGRSLGVDLVPYKTCTFDCIYCDLGRTSHKTVSRQFHVSPEEVGRELELSLSVLEKKPDYITVSGSGEPTLNQHIGEIIDTIKDLTSIPVAVLTNGSLLSIEEVRNELLAADLVLPSLDAVTPFIFDAINRPHPSLRVGDIISGLIQFRKKFRRQIWLEILFCRGVNDDKEEIGKLKEAVEKIQPDRVQLNTAARPPAEDFAFALTSTQLEEIKNKFGDKAEIVSEFDAPMGDRFDSDKNDEIINLIRRRPCTAEDISKALGLRIDEVVKYLNHLQIIGAIRYKMHEDRCYYEHALTR
jgi:wyosine [tRNA(Phe)-imidazoG37] synthetase (radical SAM superfamily)